MPILAARPEQLPATVEGVRAIADAARLDPALLVDPWETPYKVAVMKDGNAVTLNMLSAGPDAPVIAAPSSQHHHRSTVHRSTARRILASAARSSPPSSR